MEIDIQITSLTKEEFKELCEVFPKLWNSQKKKNQEKEEKGQRKERREPIKKSKPYERWTIAEMKRLQELRQRGKSYKAIARLMGRTPDALKSYAKILRQRGWDI